MKVPLIIIVIAPMLLNAQIKWSNDVNYPPAYPMIPYKDFQVTANGNLSNHSKYTGFVVQLTDQNKKGWVSMDSVICYYDERLVMTSETDYRRNASSGAWDNGRKSEIKLDSAGNPAWGRDYAWVVDKNIWRCMTEINYTFDAQKRLTGVVTRYWSATANQLVNIGKTTLTYDANNNEILRLRQPWDSASGTWMNDQKITRVYDADKRLKAVFSETWDRQQKTWLNSRYNTFTFYDSGKEIAELATKWDSGKWVNLEYNVSVLGAANELLRQENYRWVPEKPECQALHETDNWSFERQGNFIKEINNIHEWDIRNDSSNIRRRETHLMNRDSIILERKVMNVDDKGGLVIKQDSIALDKFGNALYYSSTDRSGNGFFHSIRNVYYYQPYNHARVVKKNNPLRAALSAAPGEDSEIYLQLNSDKDSSIININIYNTEGQKLNSETRPLLGGFNTLLLAYKNFVAGTYRIEVMEPATQKKSTLDWVVKKSK